MYIELVSVWEQGQNRFYLTRKAKLIYSALGYDNELSFMG